MDKVLTTRIVSAQFHKQLLEDVRILGEEPAVGLGEHLVHRLLRQVYQLSEEICRGAGTARIRHQSVSQLCFCVRTVGSWNPLRRTVPADPVHHETDNMNSIHDLRTPMVSPTPSLP